MRKETNMSKKLKIQFWKAEKALVMQILEQEGLPKCKEDGFVNIIDSPWIDKKKLFLRGDDSIYNWKVSKIEFDTNTARDEYLQKIVNAITDELFTGKGELKIGEMCEVRNDEDNTWKRRKLLAIFSEKYDKRFIVEKEEYPYEHSSWDCARPITKRIEPTVEECGNVVTYTWEEK